MVNNSGQPQPVPPFRVTFPVGSAPAAEAPSASAAAGPAAATAAAAAGPASASSAAAAGPGPGELHVESYVPPNPGPYPQDQPRRNAVRFTPVQVRRAGGAGGAAARCDALRVQVPGRSHETLAGRAAGG